MYTFFATFGSDHLEEYDVDSLKTAVLLEGTIEEAESSITAIVGPYYCTTYPIDQLAKMIEKHNIVPITREVLMGLDKYSDHPFILDADVYEHSSGRFSTSPYLSPYMVKGTRLRKEDIYYVALDGNTIPENMPVKEYEGVGL